jgi:hypothetical protein
VKRFISFCLFLILSLPALAIDADNVKYDGGTIPGLNTGTVGRLDTTSDTSLIFEHAGNKLAIPYASVDASEYSSPVARHLGVLPAILVALVRARQHRHIFRIAYHDQNAIAHVVIFEVPKQMTRSLRAVLDVRAPNTFKACVPCSKLDGM